jgi:hypothetical protein
MLVQVVCVGDGGITSFVISNHYACIYNLVFLASYMRAIKSLMEVRDSFNPTHISIVFNNFSKHKEP